MSTAATVPTDLHLRGRTAKRRAALAALAGDIDDDSLDDEVIRTR